MHDDGVSHTSACHLADDVDVKGVLNVAAAVLPQMIKQQSGHVPTRSESPPHQANRKARTHCRLCPGRRHDSRTPACRPATGSSQAAAAAHAGERPRANPRDNRGLAALAERHQACCVAAPVLPESGRILNQIEYIAGRNTSVRIVPARVPPISV